MLTDLCGLVSGPKVGAPHRQHLPPALLYKIINTLAEKSSRREDLDLGLEAMSTIQRLPRPLPAFSKLRAETLKSWEWEWACYTLRDDRARNNSQLLP